MAGQPFAERRQRVARLQNVEDRGDVFQRARRSDLRGQPAASLVVALRRLQALPACAGCCDPGRRDQAPRLWRCRRLRRRARPRRSPPWLRRKQIAANPLPDRIERDARDAAGMLVRQRCRRRGRVRAAGRTGAPDLPVRGDGRLGSRDARRNSCSTSSAPGASSPRSKPRSSSAINRARASGFKSRRYCRNRSTSSPSAIPLPTHSAHTKGV